MKPTFMENRGITTLLLNNAGTINCYAKAVPIAKNTWFKDGVVIDTDLPPYEVANDQDLIIKKVSKSDKGKYTCTAENIYGQDSMKIQVEVIGDIKFIKSPTDHNIAPTKAITLFCEAKSEQNIVVQYKWRFDNNELKYGVKVIWALDSHTLLIRDAEASILIEAVFLQWVGGVYIEKGVRHGCGMATLVQYGVLM